MFLDCYRYHAQNQPILSDRHGQIQVRNHQNENKRGTIGFKS
jgi:hypothetical protein